MSSRDRQPVDTDGNILNEAVVGVAMFDEIMRKFEDSPGQQAVIRLLLERGFSVNEEGRVVSGGIEIPDTGIGRHLDDATRIDERRGDVASTKGEL